MKKKEEINQGKSEKRQECWCQTPDHFQKAAEINRSFKCFENLCIPLYGLFDLDLGQKCQRQNNCSSNPKS